MKSNHHSMTHLETLPARYTIIGAARSGLAAARYLSRQGYSVFISDTCEQQRLDFILASNELAHIPHEAVEHTERVLVCDVIILSPGVPATLPILQVATKRGIPIWSELELGFRVSQASFCAVTGSTGKSTTVSMIGSVMDHAQRKNAVCGNIGVPVVAVAPQLPPEGVAVVEVSSFQLETVDTFKPQVAAVLNLMKNHLDRYDSEDAYYQAKMEIARNLDKQSVLVLNGEDERLVQWGEAMRATTRVVFFGKQRQGFEGVWAEGENVVSSLGGERQIVFNTGAMVLKGWHNVSNGCAAAAVSLCMGVSVEDAGQGVCAFGGLPHRLTFVAQRNGVRYYNDSKSTTAESMLAAMSAFGRQVYLIAGGRDKGCGFESLREAVGTYVKEAILIGEAADRIGQCWRGAAPMVKAASMEDAVAHAAAVGRSGDVVVLSPGCSSFDMFKSYEERGERFAELVRQLSGSGEERN